MRGTFGKFGLETSVCEGEDVLREESSCSVCRGLRVTPDSNNLDGVVQFENLRDMIQTSKQSSADDGEVQNLSTSFHSEFWMISAVVQEKEELACRSRGD